MSDTPATRADVERLLAADQALAQQLQVLIGKLDQLGDKVADRSERLGAVEVELRQLPLLAAQVKANGDAVAQLAAATDRHSIAVANLEVQLDRTQQSNTKRLSEHSDQLDHLMRDAAKRAGDEAGARRVFMLLWTLGSGLAAIGSTLATLYFTGGF